VCNAQTTFKVVFKNYNTGTIVRTYDYEFSYKNDFSLFLDDSIVTRASADSLVVMEEKYVPREKMKRTVSYFNAKKQLVRKESFIEDYIYQTEEWKYDTFNRVIYEALQETGSKEHSFQRTFSFKTEKTNDGVEVTENCSFNGALEFCTTNFYDKKHVIYKQIRKNDEGKPIHIETYEYNAAGKLVQRQVYFPEFGVTKYFKEGSGDPKCYRYAPLGPEKINEENKEDILKKELLKNKAILLSNDCEDLEYKYMNSVNSILIKKIHEHNKRTVSVTIKEKIKQS
jgi:hypothetical protein